MIQGLRNISLKSTYRYFLNNWFYGSINILGLSIAFSTVILVVFYLYQETSYENCHQNADRIFRPTYHIQAQGDFKVHFARIPIDFINKLPEDIPEIEKLVRLQNKEQKYIRVNKDRFKPDHAYISDNEIFEVFSMPFIIGDPVTALTNPYSVVLTERIAQKYFSSTNIIGKEIVVIGDWSGEEKVYQVTGVIQDLPANTHLPIEMLFSFTNEAERTGWAYVYALLSEEASINDLESKMPDFIKKYLDDENSTSISFEFQPIRNIHLHSNLAREIIPNGQILYVRIFFWVGLLVWIIALVNFTNLSTALTISRGKEIGVHKVLGSSKNQLITFAYTDVILYSLVSLILGILISFLLFPPFKALTGVSIIPPLNLLFLLLIGILILSVIIAGILPSLLITSIDTLKALYQGTNWSLKGTKERINVKRIIITIQFCATIILIGSAISAIRQFNYIKNRNLGITPNQIITIPEIPDNVTRDYIPFKNRLLEVSGIIDVSACMQLPSSEIRDVGPVLIKGINEDVNEAPMMDVQIIDPDFIKMMELELLSGEDFSSKVVLNKIPEFNDDLSVEDYLLENQREYFINETAMLELGWKIPEEAIGQEINWSIGSFILSYGSIKGVIKDYHQESLKNKIDPMVLIVEPLWLKNILIKVETKNIEYTIESISRIWAESFPYTLEYHFLDELYEKLYFQDKVQLRLLSLLTLIAILMSFMGLISMVAFALKRRSKELAIRRVLGADQSSLTTLIASEYIWIYLIAVLIGIPISYKWVSEWLQNFAYHINISPIAYLLSIMSLLTLLLITIYLQTFRATRENPIKALREE